MSNKKVYREDFFVASLYVFSLLLILYSCTVATTYAFNIFTPHCIYSCEINGEEKSEINKKEKKIGEKRTYVFNIVHNNITSSKSRKMWSVCTKKKKNIKSWEERGKKWAIKDFCREFYIRRASSEENVKFVSVHKHQPFPCSV